jgi:hypothetical protein
MDDAPFPDGMLSCWEEFLSAPRTLDDLFATSLAFPLQRRREMEKMFAAVLMNWPPRVAAELGVDKGGGAWAWCHCFPSIERFIACEIRGTPYRHLLEKAFPHVEFLWLEASSYAPATVANARNWLGEDRIDAILIDSEKRHFLDDFRAYLPLMRRPGGLAIFHDVQDPGPMRDAYFKALQEEGRRGEIILDRSEAEEALARARQGLPPAHSHEGWLRTWGGRSCGCGLVWL